MISTIRSALARSQVRALPLAALALSLATTGCDKVGCFEWTKFEGACPSQEEALEYFGGTCGSEVKSVDSEPDFDDAGYCCYDITKRADDDYVTCPPF
ncbi:hypothetical protein WMF30_49720 [Sorangium sp. So ce134]